MFDYKKFVLDLFFPIECLGCGAAGEWLCQRCHSKIKINLNGGFSQIGEIQNLNQLWVVADYHQPLLEKVLHSFKYRYLTNLGEELGELLVEFLNHELAKNQTLGFDLVIPVPLSKKRKLWRGFNQSEILAKKISQQFGWPLEVTALARRYNTRPQVGLKARERLINIRGIFSANKNQLLKNKKILLVDDVITTGATMQECAKVLKQAGAKEVWGLVIAQG